MIIFLHAETYLFQQHCQITYIEEIYLAAGCRKRVFSWRGIKERGDTEVLSEKN